jgi:hypothetical protein
VARGNLLGMTLEALMDLRKQIDETLLKRRAELEQQLERMDRGIVVVGGRGGQRGSALRGRKVPPRYRGPSDLGRSWGKTSLACCCDQRWKET